MKETEHKDLSKIDTCKVRGILANALDLEDKALLLEKEIGSEPIFAMIAMGQPVARIAASLSLTIFEMNYILKRTPEHRKQYANALAFKLAEDSSKTLNHFADETALEQEGNNAARHHSNMLDRSLKILNAPSTENTGNQILIQNTTVIRSAGDIPDLPEELKNVIDAEYADTKP